MSRDVLLHPTKRAAEKVAAEVRRTLRHGRVEVAPDRSVVAWCYPALLSPEERAVLHGCDVREVPPPDPNSPLFKRKPRKWIRREVSTCKSPTKVCREIFRRRDAEGTIDDRKAALDEAIAAGVAPNTAKTVYVRFREEIGLPPYVRRLRRRMARATSPAMLGRMGKPRLEGRKVQNNVAEPVKGTTASELWGIADLLWRTLDRPPMLGEVRMRAPDVPLNTATKAFQMWRQFHGLGPQGQFHQRKARK